MIIARTIFYLNPGARGATEFLKLTTDYCRKHCKVSTLMVATSGPDVPVPGIVVRENGFGSFAAWEKFLCETLANDPEWKEIWKQAEGKNFFARTEFQTFRGVG
jgi:hypothetical protein